MRINFFSTLRIAALCGFAILGTATQISAATASASHAPTALIAVAQQDTAQSTSALLLTPIVGDSAAAVTGTGTAMKTPAGQPVVMVDEEDAAGLYSIGK